MLGGIKFDQMFDCLSKHWHLTGHFNHRQDMLNPLLQDRNHSGALGRILFISRITNPLPSRIGYASFIVQTLPNSNAF